MIIYTISKYFHRNNLEEQNIIFTFAVYYNSITHKK